MVDPAGMALVAPHAIGFAADLVEQLRTVASSTEEFPLPSN